MKTWLAKRSLGVVSLLAALALTAQAEWSLALAVGWNEWVAWAAPVALDSYVIASFRAGKDRGWALGLMSAAVFMAHAAPVAFPAGFPWWLAGACSIVPPIVAWRIHELRRLIAGDEAGEPAITDQGAGSAGAPLSTGTAEETPAPSSAVPASKPDPKPVKPAVKKAPRKGAGGGSKAAREVAELAEALAGPVPVSLKEWRLARSWSPRTADRRMADAKALLEESATGGSAMDGVADDETEREEAMA